MGWSHRKRTTALLVCSRRSSFSALRHFNARIQGTANGSQCLEETSSCWGQTPLKRLSKPSRWSILRSFILQCTELRGLHASDRAALVLGSDPKSEEDGLLQVHQIRDLSLNADLVSLSACDTGVG